MITLYYCSEGQSYYTIGELQLGFYENIFDGDDFDSFEDWLGYQELTGVLELVK